MLWLNISDSDLLTPQYAAANSETLRYVLTNKTSLLYVEPYTRFFNMNIEDNHSAVQSSGRAIEHQRGSDHPWDEFLRDFNTVLSTQLANHTSLSSLNVVACFRTRPVL